ncbi:MAG: Gfo/Idh/MocA family oxidoreductase [SAR202 cluster bacterium]|nr:Gfo/Idh/MocA family oxidoreductase [SAR202 cluster bacterium]
MAQLSVGIVGAGFIASLKHLPALQALRGKARIAAICDQNTAQARKLAEKFGVRNVFQSVDEMLAKEKLDVVDICTPPATHSAVAIQAIEAGRNVLIEKPMALHVGECDAIIQAAQRCGVKVCVVHSDLFYPPFLKARKLVAGGALGDFMGMRVFLSTPASYMTSRQDHWAHRLPGGVIGETGPHIVYMTLAYINPIKDVAVHAFKRLPQYPWSAFEDYRLELIGEKASCSVTAVYTSNQWSALVDLWGTEGGMTLDLEAMSLVRHRRPALSPARIATSQLSESLQMVRDTVVAGTSVLSKRYARTHDILIAAFLESIVRGTEPPVTAEEGREAVRVMNLIAERLAHQKLQSGVGRPA